jgi:5'(3')-deoxyribonucleotidase
MGDVQFVLGVDLDGVVADFYGALRPIAAEWLGVPVTDLTDEVSYGLPEWNLRSSDEYQQLHRFAVTQKDIFRNLRPLPGAAATLRRLAYERDIRIRIITHRLYIKYTHRAAIQQTTEWLETQGVPYWDLCFMGDKGAVGASLYIEDSPPNIDVLKRAGKNVIIFANSTNRTVEGKRAHTWQELEGMVISELAEWEKRKSGASKD